MLRVGLVLVVVLLLSPSTAFSAEKQAERSSIEAPGALSDLFARLAALLDSWIPDRQEDGGAQEKATAMVDPDG